MHDPPLILIADAHTPVRERLKLLVSQILGEARFVDAHDGASLLEAAARSELCLALVDLEMEGMNGGARLFELSRMYPQLPLVIVPKNSGIAIMRAAVEAAMAGRRLPVVHNEEQQPRAARALTPRQEQIRSLLRQGMSNKMIARALGITAGTVKNHISEIFRVLNATNRTQVAQRPVESGD
jgi:DNA-binding NarL/FixJ family response regulator